MTPDARALDSRLVFISYAHENSGWIEALGLDRQPETTESARIWVDKNRLHAGDVWTASAGEALRNAQSAVLLVSKAFLESEAIRKHELPLIMERYRAREISVVFVPIGRVDTKDVGQALEIDHAHNVISIPSWDAPLPETPQRREYLRQEIVSAATETPEVQNLRRNILPKYHLRDSLGHGAMGRVFVAKDRELDREVCVKLLHYTGRGREFRDSVRRVAHATDHTNVLTVFGAYLHADPPHFIRQYVRGRSLRTVLDADGKPVAEDFLQALIPAVGAAALHAHGLGVSNLNIRPTNILIPEKRQGSAPYLLSLNSYGEETFLSDEKWRTESRNVLSLPPEYRAERIGRPDPHKADQYRLGLVAYEMMVGARRFEELARPLRDRDFDPTHWSWPKLADECGHCTEHLRRAVDRMVCSDPDERFADLRDALADFEANLQVEVVRESYRRLMRSEESQQEFLCGFYRAFLDEFPKVELELFGHLGKLEVGGEVPDKWKKQFQLLKEAVLLLVVYKALREDRYEPNILTRIVEEHALKMIPAELYDDFAEILVRLAAEKDRDAPQAKPELQRMWSQVVHPGIEYMKRKTGELNKARYK